MVTVWFGLWLMTKIPGPRFRRSLGLVAFVALAQEESGQSFLLVLGARLLVLGVCRPFRFQDDRQNSATGIADVTDRLSRPALEFQQIEIFAQTIQRRVTLQGAAHAVFHGLVDFCLGRGHQWSLWGHRHAELATTTPLISYSGPSGRTTPNQGFKVFAMNP
jgi:hypothetical protein